MGQVQSELTPKGSFTLQAIHCGHTSINFGKKSSSLLIFTLFFSHTLERIHITGCIKGRWNIFG